jgi:hypothetical protein
MSRKKHVKSCDQNPSASSPAQGAAERPASPAPRRCPASPSSLARRPAAAARAAGSKRKADDDASSGGGTTRSGRAKGVVSRYDPTAVARAPQWGRAPSPKDGKTRRASMGCTSGADRRFEPLDRAALPPCAPDAYAPEPDLLYAAAWAPSADAADDLARLRALVPAMPSPPSPPASPGGVLAALRAAAPPPLSPAGRPRAPSAPSPPRGSCDVGTGAAPPSPPPRSPPPRLALGSPACPASPGAWSLLPPPESGDAPRVVVDASPPDALALEALFAAKMDVGRARSALERRAVGVQSGARPGRSECEALLEAHGGDVNHVAKQRCGDDAPLRRSVTGDLLAALYARRTYYGDDDSSVGAFEAEHGVDDDASDSESSEEEDDDGARVVVCDDWAGERAVRESVLLPLADRAARRFYDRARASWGGASWDLRRGKTGAETLAPQICEPGNPNARYTVLCVEIYVDSDDNTPVMAFRWFYKKSDLDKKLGADVDAKDELVLARSIHSTPLEYVRGAVVVHDSDGPAKAAGPKGKRAPVFFCTRDYDERKKKLYKRQL